MRSRLASRRHLRHKIPVLRSPGGRAFLLWVVSGASTLTGASSALHRRADLLFDVRFTADLLPDGHWVRFVPRKRHSEWVDLGFGVLLLRRIRDDAAERQGWRHAANRGCVSWSPILRLAVADQAPACERRSHSPKPMRPRRASPNGTSERSSTRPPKYRASGSLTTSRGSPTAFR
jgi:hypothetical protein